MKYAKIEGYTEFDEDSNYGFFGYPRAMVHAAIGRDDDAGLSAMLAEGWITKESKTMENLSMRKVCLLNGAEKCASLFD